jgi:hypothetical protein
MKRPTPAPTEKVLLVFCVECGAMAGAWCQTKTGRRAPLHAARVGVATDPDYWRQLEERRLKARQPLRPELLVFAIALIAGVAIAMAGCGQVQDAADDAQLAPGGASGAAADAGALAGAGGAGGAPIASATGGAAAAGRGGAGDAGHDYNGGAAGSQTGGAAGNAACPKVGSLVNKVGSHCWVCQEENDAGFVSGTIAGPCEISAADIARFSGAAPAGSLCVSSTRGTYPAVCY